MIACEKKEWILGISLFAPPPSPASPHRMHDHWAQVGTASPSGIEMVPEQRMNGNRGGFCCMAVFTEEAFDTSSLFFVDRGRVCGYYKVCAQLIFPGFFPPVCHQQTMTVDESVTFLLGVHLSVL